MNSEHEKMNVQATTNANAPTGSPAATGGAVRASRGSRYLVVISVVAVLAIGYFAGVIQRVRAQARLMASTRQEGQTIVNVTNASHPAHGVELSLPGDVHAFEQTEIYARADGYLLKWHSDIGSKVEAGQVLADIDTPELDQELNQARAVLEQAQANLTLARTSSERWQGLLQQHAVSQQEVDEKAGALAARQADLQAAEAAVARLSQLTSFKQVRAPFAGTITRRLVDPGALIRAGGSGNASALFQLAQMDTLRVHVNVPQAYLRDVATGAGVHVRVAEYPERVFAGKVVRTSGAFDPGTRTLLTEIEVPNRDGALFPGIHVDVELSLQQSNPPLVVPSTSVMVRSMGPQVAVVNESDAIRLQKVQLGRDLGQTVEIVAGLKEGDRVVTNPTDALVDGAQVKVAGTKEPKAANTQVAQR